MISMGYISQNWIKCIKMKNKNKINHMLKTIQENKIHKMCLLINTFWILFLVDPDIRRGKIQPTNLWIYDHRGLATDLR